METITSSKWDYKPFEVGIMSKTPKPEDNLKFGGPILARSDYRVKYSSFYDNIGFLSWLGRATSFQREETTSKNVQINPERRDRNEKILSRSKIAWQKGYHQTSF